MPLNVAAAVEELEDVGGGFAGTQNPGAGRDPPVDCNEQRSDGGGFGMGVAMDGDTIAITEPGDDSGSPPDEASNSVPDSGAVYVFSTNCANVPAGASVPGC